MSRLLIVAVLLALFAPTVQAVEIPRAAYTHKRLLLQQSRLVWGLDAPTATFAAQIHQESLWRADAVSRVGAAGLAQFMPATGEWIVTVYRDLGKHEPTNPAWAIRALATYNRHHYKLLVGANDCERWAKTLSAYNGGLSRVIRAEAMAEQEGYDPLRWFGHVEMVNPGRSIGNYAENSKYTRRILLELEGVYAGKGFGRGVCDGGAAANLRTEKEEA
ncbi:MAG: transglycosylase SLT domain-containing protein [Burkholderiales bacterium]|jgi:soluble lytic murein transglycosylase-like protein|nr:transglycosylase SLT domain-containing protein [Burkholderiales bacterium]